MIKFDYIQVFNFEGAFRGLRNPLNSHAKSDSSFPRTTGMTGEMYGEVVLGPNDINLAQRMIKGGTDESKFLRQIFVCLDITAPLFWWKEYDTYKVATVANSTSTMHKLAQTPITYDNISFDEEDGAKIDFIYKIIKKYATKVTVKTCEFLRKKYLKTKDKKYWRLLIQLLPDGWMQTRTVTLNYQTLRAMYFARKNHKVIEWRKFCQMVETLPYAEELICYNAK